jgi:hypothetical protein
MTIAAIQSEARGVEIRSMAKLEESRLGKACDVDRMDHRIDCLLDGMVSLARAMDSLAEIAAASQEAR